MLTDTRVVFVFIVLRYVTVKILRFFPDQYKMKIKVMRDNVIDLLVFLALALVYIVESVVQFFVPINYRTKRISGDVVLITGGGGGLGRLLAERFAKLGCIIVVWDINKKGNPKSIHAFPSSLYN